MVEQHRKTMVRRQSPSIGGRNRGGITSGLLFLLGVDGSSAIKDGVSMGLHSRKVSLKDLTAKGKRSN